MGEYTDLIAKIEEEAERRGITLKDRKSKFYKNAQVLKKAV
jgi:hypothetical protein